MTVNHGRGDDASRFSMADMAVASPGLILKRRRQCLFFPPFLHAQVSGFVSTRSLVAQATWLAAATTRGPMLVTRELVCPNSELPIPMAHHCLLLSDSSDHDNITTTDITADLARLCSHYYYHRQTHLPPRCSMPCRMRRQPAARTISILTISS